MKKEKTTLQDILYYILLGFFVILPFIVYRISISTSQEVEVFLGEPPAEVEAFLKVGPNLSVGKSSSVGLILRSDSDVEFNAANFDILIPDSLRPQNVNLNSEFSDNFTQGGNSIARTNLNDLEDGRYRLNVAIGSNDTNFNFLADTDFVFLTFDINPSEEGTHEVAFLERPRFNSPLVALDDVEYLNSKDSVEDLEVTVNPRSSPPPDEDGGGSDTPPGDETGYILEPTTSVVELPAGDGLKGYGVNFLLKNSDTEEIVVNQSGFEYSWSIDDPDLVTLETGTNCFSEIQEPCPEMHANISSNDVPGETSVNVDVMDSTTDAVIASASVQVIVEQNTSPTLDTFTLSEESVVQGEQIEVTLVASDAENNLERARLFLDDEVLTPRGDDPSYTEGTFTYSFGTGDLSTGEHSVEAIVFDKYGAGTSESGQLPVRTFEVTQEGSQSQTDYNLTLEPDSVDLVMSNDGSQVSYNVSALLKDGEVIVEDQSFIGYEWSGYDESVISLEGISDATCYPDEVSPCSNSRVTVSSVAEGNTTVTVKALHKEDESVLASASFPVSVTRESADVSARNLDLTLRLQSRGGSLRGHAQPVVFVGLWRPSENRVLESVITATDSNGKVVLENFFGGNGSQYELSTGDVIIVKPESYLSKDYVLESLDKSADGTTVKISDTKDYLAGDIIVDIGTFDVVNVRDYVFFRSYYGRSENYDYYYLDYNGDNRVTVLDFVPLSVSGNLGLRGSTENYDSTLVEYIERELRNSLYQVIEL